MVGSIEFERGRLGLRPMDYEHNVVKIDNYFSTT